MIRVHTDEFDCPHGRGWRTWVEDGKGKNLGVAWERETAQESKAAAIDFFWFLDKDVYICRMKTIKGRNHE